MGIFDYQPGKSQVIVVRESYVGYEPCIYLLNDLSLAAHLSVGQKLLERTLFDFTFQPQFTCVS